MMKTKCQRLLNPETLEDYGLSVTEDDARKESTPEGDYVVVMLEAARERKKEIDKDQEIMAALGRSVADTVNKIAFKVFTEKPLEHLGCGGILIFSKKVSVGLGLVNEYRCDKCDAIIDDTDYEHIKN